MSTTLLRCPWYAVLVGLLLDFTGNSVGAADPPPPSTSTVLAGVPLQVLLRTADGTPVPGIGITLVPAAADAGGPPVGTPVQHGLTDENGLVTFGQIQGAIWSVRFQGVYQGQPLVLVATQGQPPYGTTRGGGFVVQTALQEENDAPAPVVGQPAPAVETLAFVMLPTGGEWTPAIDLEAPGAAPQPLGTAAAPPELPFMSPPKGGTGSAQNANKGQDLTLVWWLLLLGAVAGALFGTWWERQLEQRTDPLSTDELGSPAAGVDRHDHV